MQKQKKSGGSGNTAPVPYFYKIIIKCAGYPVWAFLNVIRPPYLFIKKRAAGNYNRNAEAKVTFPLNGQELPHLRDFSMGIKQFGFNGCGAIATFNALSLLGLKPSLAEIVRFYERKGILFYGLMGVNPVAVGKYLKSLGIRWKRYTKVGDFMADFTPGKSGILLYWWGNKKGLGAHYVAVEPLAQGIRVYNMYGRQDSSCEFAGIEEFLETGNYKRVVGWFLLENPGEESTHA